MTATSDVAHAVAARGRGASSGGGEPERSTAIASNGVFGMTLFVLAEAMLFAGLISGIEIIKASAMVWPPPGQPHLPVSETAINTAALMASAVCLVVAHRAFHRGQPMRMRLPMWFALGLGIFFVAFQGVEWVLLIREGLTIRSSNLGSFFFLTVGLHGLHALGAIGLLGYACVQLEHGRLSASLFGASEVLWFFVVGAWPILYGVVYW